MDYNKLNENSQLEMNGYPGQRHEKILKCLFNPINKGILGKK